MRSGLGAAWCVAAMTLRRAIRGRRLAFTVLMLALPLGLSLLFVHNARETTSHVRFLYPVLSFLHFGLVVPLVALTFATTFPWPAADDGTLTYWFTSPIPRWSVVLGRYGAQVALGCLVLPLSVLGLLWPLQPPEAFDTAAMAWSAVEATWLAYPAYLALFSTVTITFRWGVVFAIVFVVVENFLSLFQGAIQRITLVFYTRCRLTADVPDGLTDREVDSITKALQTMEPVAPGYAAIALATVAVAALLASLVFIHLIEYRGKHASP